MKEGMKLIKIVQGEDGDIWLRFISEWSKVDSYVPKERLLSEIEKVNPDVVVIDLDLYARVGGIEAKRKIEGQFDIPVWYE